MAQHQQLMVHKMTRSRVLKKVKKCAAGKALLKTQMLNLNYKNLHENPFEISEDVAAAEPSFNVIEEDEDDDIKLDIM